MLVTNENPFASVFLFISLSSCYNIDCQFLWPAG